MFNLVKAELYKVCKRTYSKVFIGVVAGVIVLINILLSVVQAHFENIVPTRSEMILIYAICLEAGMYLAIVTTDMVFSEEYKHGTLKNTVAFGYTRGQTYFSKLIAASVVTVVMALMIAGICLLSCWPLFKTADTDLAYTGYFIKYLLMVLPLYLSQVAISIAVWFNIKNATFGSILVVCYTAVFPMMLELVSILTEKEVFCKIANLLPIRQMARFQQLCDFSDVSVLAGDFMLNGACFFIGFTLIGWLFFRRKEIK